MWGTKETLPGAPVPPSALDGTPGLGPLTVSPLMSCSCNQNMNVQCEKLFAFTNGIKFFVLTTT